MLLTIALEIIFNKNQVVRKMIQSYNPIKFSFYD